jgi:hypothetical protein
MEVAYSGNPRRDLVPLLAASNFEFLEYCNYSNLYGLRTVCSYFPSGF